MMIEEAERDENEKIAILKNKLIEFESRNKDMLLNMKTKIKKMKEEVQKKDIMIKELSKNVGKYSGSAQKEESPNKGVKVLE